MVTPAELSLGAKFVTWAKRAVLAGKRIAMLEARVTALEEALATQPASACPYCGERAMRMTEKSLLLGDQGTQWWEEYWSCEKCTRNETRHRKLV